MILVFRLLSAKFFPVINTYVTDLLVSFQLRLGLAVHIVKFRPKQPEKLHVGCTLAV